MSSIILFKRLSTIKLVLGIFIETFDELFSGFGLIFFLNFGFMIKNFVKYLKIDSSN